MSMLGYLLGFLGGWEIALVAGVALLLFGSRLPVVGRSVGSAIVQFRKAIKGSEDGEDTADTENPPVGRVEGRKNEP